MWTERRGGEASVCPRELLHRDKNRNPRDWFLFPRRSQLRIPDAGFRGLHPEPGSPHPGASPPPRGVQVFLRDAILLPEQPPADSADRFASSAAQGVSREGIPTSFPSRDCVLAD